MMPIQNMQDLGIPVGPPALTSDEYMIDCSEALLVDLVSFWNFHVYGCCKWHAALQRLRSIIDDRVQRTYDCTSQWSPPDIEWQCQNCSALVKPGILACWVCDTESISRINLKSGSAT